MKWNKSLIQIPLVSVAVFPLSFSQDLNEDQKVIQSSFTFNMLFSYSF